jgi:hypothetical protein
MGLDVYGITVLGVPVTESDFLVTLPLGRGCPRAAGHSNSATAKFCSECGTALQDLKRKEPTAAWAKLLSEGKIDPLDWENWSVPRGRTAVGVFRAAAWAKLLSEGKIDPLDWENWSVPRGRTAVGVFRVNAVQESAFAPLESQRWALGVKLGETKSNRSCKPEEVCALPYGEIIQAMAKLVAVEQDLLGEERSLQLFTCMTLSY